MSHKGYHIFKKSKEVNTVFENFASLTILQILGYVFPLLTLPYLSRVIGVSKFGVLAFANVIISYFSTLVYFGFQYTGVRDISRNKNNILELNRIVSNVFFSMSFLLLISFFVLLIISSFPYFHDYRLILFLTFLNVPAQILNFDWFFQGIEKMKYFTILSFISRFIFTVSIFFVIKTQSDFILIPFLTFIGTLFSGLFALYLIFIRYKVRIYFPGIKNIIETLKLGWSVFISLIAPNLYNSFSTVVLKIFYGDIAVGIYDAGRRVNSISEQLPIILSKATFPFLSRRIDKHKSFMKYNMMLCLFISILNLVFAEIIVKILYTPEFNKAVWVIRIMAFTPFAYSLVNGYGINYLLQVGKEKVFKNIILLCSVLGFILLFVLIPFFSFYGAAATVLIIYFLKGIISRHYALKLIK